MDITTRGAAVLRGVATLADGRDRVPVDPGDQTSNARVRSDRLPRRLGRLDRREVPELERLRWGGRAVLYQGRATDSRDALLGHRRHRRADRLSRLSA